MFGFFRRKPAADPPSVKQLAYAKRLKIAVTPQMSKADVSAAIGDMERLHPELAQKREEIKEKQHERKYGKALVDAEQRWCVLSESVRFMLAIYRKGGNTIVDVVDVGGAHIDGRGKLKLELAAPKLV